MSHSVRCTLCLLLLLFTACTDDGDAPRDATACRNTPPADAPTFGRGTVLFEGDEGTEMLAVDVADSPEQHAFGLMGRSCMPGDEGMVFLFFQDNQGGFYMYRTLIPLSIAFFDVDGKVLEILDMEPCESEEPARCTIYDPGVTYRGALEVNQGTFDRLGLEVGDTLRIVQ